MKKLLNLWLALVLAVGAGPVGLVQADSAAPPGAAVQPLALSTADGETVITLGTPITVSGSGAAVSGSTVTISAGGSYRALGTLADGTIVVNTSDAVELTLAGVNLTHSSGPAISVTSAAKLTLILAAGTSNTLVDGATYSDTGLKSTLFSNDPLEISGSGALTVTANYKHAVASDDNLIISGGSITIVSAVKDGFHANDDITISGGTLQVLQAGSDGLESEGTLTLSSGTLTLAAVADGLKSAADLTIGGGTLTVTAAARGVESKANLVVNAGTLSLTTSADGLSATTGITLNGGQVGIDAAGTAVASAGTLNVNGGVIVALGGSSPDGGMVSASGTILFTGGTVVAGGGANSTPSNASTQHVVVMGSREVDSLIQIVGAGNTVLTFKASQAYQTLLFSSPDLAADTTYTAYSGGTLSGGSDFHGLYTGATVSGGSMWVTFTTHTIVTYTIDIVRTYLPLMFKSGDTSSVTTITLGSPITVSGSGATVAGSTVTITAAGTYRAAGTLNGGQIAINTTGEVTLILDGVNLTCTSGPAINGISATQLAVVLADGSTNTLADGATYTDTTLKGTLFSNDPLEISGSGALTVTGRYKHGIVSDDSLAVKGGTITIASAVTDGFHANDSITLAGGTIKTLQVGSDGLESEGTLVMTAGTLNLTVADDGLVSAGLLTLNGGTVTVNSGVEGIESKDQIIVNAGEISIAVSDDGLNAANNITINGGQLYINANADAVDSNGTLTINGGVLVALGGNVPEGGLDCDACAIALNGGIVVASGGANSNPSTASSQRVAVLGSKTAGTLIHIGQGTNDVLTFKISKAYQSMIFTSPALAANTSYTAYTGGSVSGGTEFHGLYTGATYTPGSTWATFTTTAVVTYVGTGPRPPGP